MYESVEVYGEFLLCTSTMYRSVLVDLECLLFICYVQKCCSRFGMSALHMLYTEMFSRFGVATLNILCILVANICST